LSEINPASREYPKALTVMGFQHWIKYKTAKKQIEAEQAQNEAGHKDKNFGISKDALAKRDEDRKQALEIVEKAVKAQDTARPEGAAIPEALRDSQLLLAEIYKEGEDFKKAYGLYKGLIDDILKAGNKPFDETTLRIFDGAGQVCLKLGDFEKAAAVGAKLIELGPDDGQVNAAIMNFARRLEIERKNSLAEGESGDPNVPGTGAAKLKALTELQEKTMISISKRDKLSADSMVWIVMTLNKLGSDDACTAAANLIEKIFDKANDDQNFESKIEPRAVALHALGASLQARLGQYSKAQEQIAAVIQKYPRALEPRISEAKILTEWASKKDSSKYADAINKWDTLRKKVEHSGPLGKASKSVEPKYDIILNEADCFYRWTQKTKSKDDAKKGMDLLNPYLNLDDKIRNPSDEYKELSVKYYQLAGKLADFLGMPKPVRPRPKRAH
jgi:hypothetical protein